MAFGRLLFRTILKQNLNRIELWCIVCCECELVLNAMEIKLQPMIKVQFQRWSSFNYFYFWSSHLLRFLSHRHICEYILFDTFEKPQFANLQASPFEPLLRSLGVNGDCSDVYAQVFSHLKKILWLHYTI